MQNKDLKSKLKKLETICYAQNQSVGDDLSMLTDDELERAFAIALFNDGYSLGDNTPTDEIAYVDAYLHMEHKKQKDLYIRVCEDWE